MDIADNQSLTDPDKVSATYLLTNIPLTVHAFVCASDVSLREGLTADLTFSSMNMIGHVRSFLDH